MPKTEFLSPEGFRLDGRRQDELRSHLCKIDCSSITADGSAYFEIGNTRVLAYVYGPFENKRRSDKVDKTKIHCNVIIASYSTADRRVRSKNNRLSQELSFHLVEIFQSSLFLENYTYSKIQIFAYILEMDGGIRNALTNACCLAIVDAGIPMPELVVSCSASLIDNIIFTDPTSAEINAGGADLTITMMADSHKIISVLMNSRVPMDMLEPMHEACTSGCKEVTAIMKSIIREKSLQRYQGMTFS